MSRVVGIHGIAQEQLGRRQLLDRWVPAFMDGIEIASSVRPDELEMDLAYYGHLFLDRGGDGLKGGLGEPLGVPVDSEAFVLSMAAEVLGVAAPTNAESATSGPEVLDLEGLDAALGSEEVGEKGVAPPAMLLRVVRVLDRRFGARAGGVFLRVVAQAYRYLSDESVRDEVHRIVESVITKDTRIVVAHSLGSVVALEHLRRNPGWDLRALVTLGSPLGLRAMQARLDVPFFGSEEGRPGNLQYWLNVRDVRDPIACAGDLSKIWSGLIDLTVDNGGDAHSAVRYLSKGATCAPLVAELPELITASDGGR